MTIIFFMRKWLSFSHSFKLKSCLDTVLIPTEKKRTAVLKISSRTFLYSERSRWLRMGEKSDLSDLESNHSGKKLDAALDIPEIIK